MTEEQPFGTDPAAGEQSELEAAMATERNLREQINDLVHARSRAEAEARRLTVRAGLEGADAALAELARRYGSQSAVLTSEISILRASVRGAEATVEKLRAGAGG